VQRKLWVFLFAVLAACSLVVTVFRIPEASALSNGGWSADITHPDYGTHDWIAQHALDWLPAQEKQVLTDNLASYLYGTELPDNKNTPSGVGDTTKHHVYFNADGSLKDNASAVRAEDEYVNAKQAYSAGNFTDVALHLGMVTHYVSDMAVFGHMMGASTAWGTETHHSDYEDYVQGKTKTYASSVFDVYLAFDGALATTSAYDTAIALARDTTFSVNGNCTWMDQHYNWSDTVFKNRAGQSLNLAVNLVADVLHTFYTETAAPSPSQSSTSTPSSTTTPTASAAPTQTPQVPEFPAPLTAALLFAALATAAVLLLKSRVKKHQ
jgi:hypothetical protein